VRWGFDFAGITHTAQVLLEGNPAAEYGIAEFHIAEYGSGELQRAVRIPGAGTGQYFRIGIDIAINGHPFGIQAINALYEPGRLF
jgi:hypothetical protein